MDVLYVFKAKAPDDEWDLRMSLRMLERNGRNLGKVVVAGEPPGWLSDEVVRIPVSSPYDRKQKNILHAIFGAIERGAITGPALYSSADHFMMRRYDLDRFPWFGRAGMPVMPAQWTDIPGPTWRQARFRPYWGSIIATRQLLEARGYPVDFVSGHANTHIDARDIAEVRGLAGMYWATPWGFEPSTLFIAARRRHDPSIQVTLRSDLKPASIPDAFAMERLASTGDGLLSLPHAPSARQTFRSWAEAHYPRARFER